MDSRIVIRDALLPGPPPLAGASVVVEGRRLVRVAGPGERIEPRPGDWDVDAAGRLLLPGGVDAHAHLAAGPLLRLAGLPERWAGSVPELRARFRRPLEERLDAPALEALAAAGALAALRAGVTCAFDLERGAPGQEEEALAAVARAARRVGIRAALAYGASDAGGVHRALAAVRAGNAFAESVRADATLRGMAGLDGLAETGPETLAALAGPAARHGLHASVGEDEADLARCHEAFGLRPVQVLGSHALLGERTVVGHGGAAGGEEATLLARTWTVLAATPRAALFWGGPLAPLEDLAAHGAPLALGTDGLHADVAGEAVAAAMLLRRGRSVPPPAELVGYAVWPGAAGLASRVFGDRIGAVEAGALADLVILDWRPPYPLPDVSAGDLALLWAGAPAAWAIVDGAVRLREGRLLGADEVGIAARAREAAARVLGS